MYASATDTDMSEWVGIDGVNDPNLIQAGVREHYDHATNHVSIYAWWEILPAYETPMSTLPVRPGDQITVRIGGVSPGSWTITVTDSTTGQNFIIEQTYTGTAATAEWIVETPSRANVTQTLGYYTPNVTFSNLRLRVWVGSPWPSLALHVVVVAVKGHERRRGRFAI